MTASGKNVLQVVKLKDGLDSDTAKKINKAIKESGIKVQSSIQGDKIRVTDKKARYITASNDVFKRTTIWSAFTIQ